MARRDPWSFVNVVGLAAAVTVMVALWVLVDLQGWAYYTTPMRVRGYAAPHRMLKPSGSVAHPLGVAGLAMLVVPVVYVLRKRWSRLARAGAMRAWLEVHIFCGIVGPVLVTFHTSLRFNGVISVAYWSMLAVMLSGFVGRYLFVRLPRTIRGVELSHDEIRARVDELSDRVLQKTTDAALADRVRAFEQKLGAGSGRAGGWRQARRQVRGLRRELRSAGVGRELVSLITAAMAERAQLLRKLAYLNRNRRLFSAWHVFHQPLVYVMFAIAAVHIAVALYFGYSWW